MRSLTCFAVLVAAGIGLFSHGAEPKQDGGQGKLDCTLYTKPYKSNEHGAYVLPSGLKWKVPETM